MVCKPSFGGLPARQLAWVLVVGWHAGCGATALDEFEVCSLDLAPSAAAGAPGEEIVLAGGPMSEVRDTRVEVGGHPAVVTAVTREGCDACDSCRLEAECAPCGLCNGIALAPDRRLECFGDPLADPAVAGLCAACTESLTFQVPADAPVGPTSVLVINENGQSPSIPFEVSTGGSGSTGGTGAPTSPSGSGAPSTGGTGAAR
ncbi:MAG: hypothetical protein ABMA64_25285 [Myxococcota bacterium]